MSKQNNKSFNKVLIHVYTKLADLEADVLTGANTDGLTEKFITTGKNIEIYHGVMIVVVVVMVAGGGFVR